MSQSVPVAARRGVDPAELDDGEPDDVPDGRRPTRRWRGVAGIALLAVGVGLLLEEPAALLVGAVGVAAAAAAGLGRAPAPELTVERSIADAEPEPGDVVRVALHVRNESGAVLPDLRVVDGVPDGLRVVEGSPRLATALRDGERATLTYAVRARHGEHAFDPPTAISRDLAGATEQVERVGTGQSDDGAADVDADGATDVDGRAAAADPSARGDAGADAITCAPPLPADPVAFPLRPQTTRFTGRTTADEGGTGVEFHATREYRPGDPLARIDWRRTARTRDLTTVEFRRERAAAVLLVVDARPAAAVAPAPTAETAVERAVLAAREVAASLLADGHTVGLAAIAPDACWLAPGRGPEHRVELRDLLAGAAAFRRCPPDEDVNVYGAVRSIRRRIASDAQVVLCTPLTDDAAADAALRFDAHDHATTVVSPDPTTDGSVGQRVASLGRRTRLDRVRRAGVPVVDWARGEPLERAVARSEQRWSR